MVGAKKQEDTYAAREALPENVIGEIMGGELFVQPRPASPHAQAAIALTSDIYATFGRGRGGPGGWVLLTEPELHVGPRPDIIIPDVAGWRRERMPVMPEVSAMTLAPDWVCELLSPSTAAIDRSRKLPIYAREGVSHAWLIDPVLKTLEVYRLVAEKWVLMNTHVGDQLVRAEPFEALELELSLLWSR